MPSTPTKAVMIHTYIQTAWPGGRRGGDFKARLGSDKWYTYKTVRTDRQSVDYSGSAWLCGEVKGVAAALRYYEVCECFYSDVRRCDGDACKSVL